MTQSTLSKQLIAPQGQPDGLPARDAPSDTGVSRATEVGPQETPGVLVGQVRRIDPKVIRIPAHSNRATSAYTNEEFDVFRDMIQASGGNTQPITVRRATEPEQGYLYDLINGHRRHRACLDLGLDVLAVVEPDCGDRNAYLLRLRENSGRVDLTPWELGHQVLEGIKSGHLRSIRHAGSVTGRDPSDLAKAVQLAELDPVAISAFASPTELQYRHAKPLADAIKANREAVLTEARRIAALAPRPSGAEIVGLLTAAAGAGVGRSHSVPRERTLTAGGQSVGRIKDRNGNHTVVEIDVPLAERERESLAKAIERIVAKRLTKADRSAAGTTEAKP